MTDAKIIIEDGAVAGIDAKLTELFTSTVHESIKAGMFKEFCRLSGYKAPKNPIDMMIDKSTGRLEKIAFEFFEFVRDYVFLPCLDGRAEQAFQ